MFAVFSDETFAPLCANEASPCIVLPLKHRFTEKVIVFGATHLKSKPSEENELRREGQITTVLNMMLDCSIVCEGDSMMLLGDFNTDSFSVPKLQAKVIPHVMSWNGGCLSHAYPLPSGETKSKQIDIYVVATTCTAPHFTALYGTALHCITHIALHCITHIVSSTTRV
jgi:hypothetical protein